ncbi:MAG: energy-coupling factor transporter transmembrane component T family protein, partial [Armatimonadota bacterium]
MPHNGIMATFLYVEKQSVLHRLHPAAKVIALVLVFAAAMAFRDPLPELLVLALAVATAWAANGLGTLRRVWKFCAVIFFFTTLLWTLFQQTLQGGAEFQLISWSRQSFMYGLAMGLRIDAFLIAGLALLCSTRTEEFTIGLRALGLPQMMALAFSIAFRLVPTFANTAGTVVQAQRSRGHDVAAGGLFRRIRASIPLV